MRLSGVAVAFVVFVFSSTIIVPCHSTSLLAINGLGVATSLTSVLAVFGTTCAAYVSSFAESALEDQSSEFERSETDRYRRAPDAEDEELSGQHETDSNTEPTAETEPVPSAEPSTTTHKTTSTTPTTTTKLPSSALHIGDSIMLISISAVISLLLYV